MNNVVLIGRLTKDPELRYIPGSGNAVSNFTLAVDKGVSKEKKQEMESKNQPTADFIRIVVWGRIAENCANYLAKGRLIAVEGRIQTGSYDDKDGKRIYTSEVVGRTVEFLEWGDSNESKDFNKSNKSNNSNNSNDTNDSSSDFGGIEGFHPTDNDDIPF